MAATTLPETSNFMFSEEERVEMVGLLEQVLGETRVEVHRTHTPGYRASGDQPGVTAPRSAGQASTGLCVSCPE